MKTSHTFFAPEILNYYEKNAVFDSNDREYIIKRGFHEWLLGAIGGHTAEKRRKNSFMPHTLHVNPETEIVTLIANLIGGVTTNGSE